MLLTKNKKNKKKDVHAVRKKFLGTLV